VCAIIALLHDVLVVLGMFAILGLVLGVEIDALFVTAMLTVIGFSVHDTIVVFDRVRENIARRRFERFEDVVNYSVVQTLARSINTSITVLLTLFALYLFGGVSIRNFVLALLIGIISGTYSSIFNASMLLVIWENREWGRLFGRTPTPTPGTRGAAAR
jgi:preprotein translocase subunit SecF